MKAMLIKLRLICQALFIKNLNHHLAIRGYGYANKGSSLLAVTAQTPEHPPPPMPLRERIPLPRSNCVVKKDYGAVFGGENG
ncbi:MAG: hypothetical protein LBK60_10055, partial [Verrucomicrobiales bacterium]|nr:hypothetical protein [Verrucomicrobiales bacterium]